MVEFINELISCFALLIDVLFNKLEFVKGSGITIGYILLGLTLMTLVVQYLYGRTKQ